MSDDLSNRAQIRSAQRQARSKRRRQLELLARLLADVDGREFFYDLLSSCHIYTPTFDPNALKMAFREGERTVGLRLTADLTTANPDAYLLMLKEQGNVRPQQPDTDDADDTSVDDPNAGAG